MKPSCPSCGAEVPFKSRFAFMAVCNYCKSTIVRHDKDLEILGKMSEMPPDMSPIQIGTTGILGKDKFEIVGRQRIGYENGSWNEWYMLFQSGKDGWLADAQGFIMVSFEDREFSNYPALGKLVPGAIITVGKTEYTADDVKQVTCKGSEGELPFKCIFGRKSTSIDFHSTGSKFCNIDYTHDEKHIFVGKYIDIEELKLENQRQVEGW